VFLRVSNLQSAINQQSTISNQQFQDQFQDH